MADSAVFSGPIARCAGLSSRNIATPSHAARMAPRRCRVALAGLAGLAIGSSVAHAHDWYPLECCSSKDCAPADTVVRNDDGSYLVTSRGLSVVIPWWFRPWRPSPDGRVHVCVRQFTGIGPIVMCAFRGPGV